MMWYGDGWGHMGGWGWVGLLFMLLFWFGVVALIIWAVAGLRSGRAPSTIEGPRGDRALMLLRERYARGEITQQEFERARETLETTRY